MTKAQELRLTEVASKLDAEELNFLTRIFYFDAVNQYSSFDYRLDANEIFNFLKQYGRQTSSGGNMPKVQRKNKTTAKWAY
jgi:hypothetical protein